MAYADTVVAHDAVEFGTGYRKHIVSDEIYIVFKVFGFFSVGRREQTVHISIQRHERRKRRIRLNRIHVAGTEKDVRICLLKFFIERRMIGAEHIVKTGHE